jgi:predicted nucleic acid-binding protein
MNVVHARRLLTSVISRFAAHHIAELLTRCWDLRDNLMAYDVSYVALAELLGTTLITADERLSRAPQVMCAVEVL